MAGLPLLSPLDLGGLEIQNAALHVLPSAPSSPALGQVYFNSSTGRAFVWVGAGWRELTNLIPEDVLAGLLQVDGADSGLDADLLDGHHASHFATAAQLDAVSLGLDIKEPVVAATTGNIALNGLQVIDGAYQDGNVQAGDRVLVKNQTTASQNGIYIAAAGAWTRAADAVPGSSLTAGAFVFVADGVVNLRTQWTLQANTTTWAQFSGISDTTAGNGLTRLGPNLHVGAGTGISVTADAVAIDTSLVARKKVFAVGGATAVVLNHNLGTRDVSVTLVRTAAPYDAVLTSWEATDLNNVTVRFAVAPGAGAYRALVVA